MTGRATPFARTRHTAFTLVELLVAIIAILMVILIPSLRRAREQARRVKCMANQRALVQAVQFFAEEHQGYGQLVARFQKWRTVGFHPRR